MLWRWDQGRLQYFQFDTIKSIASVLAKFDGVRIPDCEAVFRDALMKETGMPFSPASYTVLRNYKRVFECAFLSTAVDQYLVITDFCRKLADPKGVMTNVDDYLSTYISRFRFPFPAFDHYNNTDERVYPFCAIIKYLLGLRAGGREAVVSLKDIIEVIIANRCTGTENIEYYKCLDRKSYPCTRAGLRQLREMIIFISQLSYLKFFDGCLYLDLVGDSAVNELLDKFLQPEIRTPSVSRPEEFLSMTSLSEKIVVPTIEVFSFGVIDAEFIEGKRKRVEHFRVERSPLLRKRFIEEKPRPVCAMCGMDTSAKYPWTDYVLEIHHLLPLASAIALTGSGTSLEDIVGLCPTCHRSTHVYYRKWLKSHGQDDFTSKEEAHNVFRLATMEVG